MAIISAVEQSLIDEALKHAEKRIAFEYDRFKLETNHRISMIALGTLGQLIFRDYLVSKGVEFEFEYQAGRFDRYDFMLEEKVIEIKTSGYDDSEGWAKLHAIYNKDQMRDAVNKNIYGSVQIFVNGYDRKERRLIPSNCSQAVIAGWAPIGVIRSAPIRDLPYGSAHMVPLVTLEEIDTLIGY